MNSVVSSTSQPSRTINQRVLQENAKVPSDASPQPLNPRPLPFKGSPRLLNQRWRLKPSSSGFSPPRRRFFSFFFPLVPFFPPLVPLLLTVDVHLDLGSVISRHPVVSNQKAGGRPIPRSSKPPWPSGRGTPPRSWRAPRTRGARMRRPHRAWSSVISLLFFPSDSCFSFLVSSLVLYLVSSSVLGPCSNVLA